MNAYITEIDAQPRSKRWQEWRRTCVTYAKHLLWKSCSHSQDRPQKQEVITSVFPTTIFRNDLQSVMYELWIWCALTSSHYVQTTTNANQLILHQSIFYFHFPNTSCQILLPSPETYPTSTLVSLEHPSFSRFVSINKYRSLCTIQAGKSRKKREKREFEIDWD